MIKDISTNKIIESLKLLGIGMMKSNAQNSYFYGRNLLLKLVG
jgi:hypothetical protein